MKTYIVDIDGTLANIDHRLHFIQDSPPNWDAFFDACDDDYPIENVIDVLRSVARGNFDTAWVPDIVYLTGRPERVREKTIDWLKMWRCPKGVLLMRQDGDHRPDTIAKRELMEKIVAAGGQIGGVFEDRPSVCRVWREMGLTVFQMQDKEF